MEQFHFTLGPLFASPPSPSLSLYLDLQLSRSHSRGVHLIEIISIAAHIVECLYCSSFRDYYIPSLCMRVCVSLSLSLCACALRLLEKGISFGIL